MKLIQELKNKMITTYRKIGNNNAVKTKGKRTYTGNEIADEIENETEFGVKMVKSLIALSIELLSKDKINLK